MVAAVAAMWRWGVRSSPECLGIHTNKTGDRWEFNLRNKVGNGPWFHLTRSDGLQNIFCLSWTSEDSTLGSDCQWVRLTIIAGSVPSAWRGKFPVLIEGRSRVLCLTWQRNRSKDYGINQDSTKKSWAEGEVAEFRDVLVRSRKSKRPLWEIRAWRRSLGCP